MIQDAGVDTWFLKLPTGDWEEALESEAPEKPQNPRATSVFC